MIVLRKVEPALRMEPGLTSFIMLNKYQRHKLFSILPPNLFPCIDNANLERRDEIPNPKGSGSDKVQKTSYRDV